MRKLELDHNQILIKFDYDPEIINIIRTLPGRRYNASFKRWETPAIFINEVIYALKPLQFELSPEIVELANGEAKRVISADLSLFAYQRTGAEFIMNHKFCLLGDEQGLGKSVEAITACEELELDKILVITMSSLKENFAEEIKKWYPGARILIINGKGINARMAQYEKYAKYYIINYETMARDIEVLSKVKWDMIIADECTKIHNPQAKMSKAIKLLKADRKCAMTGTPISNTPADLWSPITWLMPGILGNWWQFKNTYCATDYWGNITSYQNLPHLQKRIAPYVLRRTKDEVMKELPEKTYVEIPVELSADERKIYKAIESEILNYINKLDLSKIDLGTINNILTKMVRLLQVADSCELVGDNIKSSKLASLKELVESLKGEKVVIFTRFSTMAKILQRELDEFKPLIVTGETPQEDRLPILNKFSGEDYQILISTETLAYGVNLQFCSYLVHYDLPWSLAKLEQRHGRLDRIGAKKNITFYSLIVKNSIDEFVKKVLYAKQKTTVEILEGIKKSLL